MQNRYCKIIVFTLCMLSTIHVYATGKRKHFLSFGPGVAAASMGGTFTAIGNDVSVIYYNPSLIGNLEIDEISANYWSLLADTRYMFLGLALQLSEHSGFAISGTQLATDSIEVRQTLEDNGSKESSSQNVINIAYSGYIESIKLSYGVGLKYLYYSIVGYSASGGALDLGLYKRIKRLRNTSIDAGLVVQNLVNVPIKLKDDRETVPVIAKGGLGLKTLLFPKYNKQKNSITYDKLTLGIDFGTEDQEFICSFGGEYMLYDLVMFRAGYNGEEINVGFGIKYYDFQFDYSYQFSEVESINKVGFIFRWGTKNKIIYSRTQNITDDFQDVYQKANRLYENSLRDSRSMIETNKLDEAIELLYRTVPLKPQDNEAINLLEVAQNKSIAIKTSQHLNKAQQLIDKNNIVESYKETLKAINIAPNNDVEQFLYDNYNTKTVATKVDSVKNTEIKQYEKTIQKALSKYDIELAKQETEKLELLSQDKAKKYYEDIQTTEESLINKYLLLADKSQKLDRLYEAYKYYSKAEQLIGQDDAIRDLKNKIRKKLLKTKENTFEEEMYTEKLYYLAAIALANNEKPKKCYEELIDFDPLFKWNDILKKYLLKNNIINKEEV